MSEDKELDSSDDDEDQEDRPAEVNNIQGSHTTVIDIRMYAYMSVSTFWLKFRSKFFAKYYIGMPYSCFYWQNHASRGVFQLLTSLIWSFYYIGRNTVDSF